MSPAKPGLLLEELASLTIIESRAQRQKLMKYISKDGGSFPQQLSCLMIFEGTLTAKTTTILRSRNELVSDIQSVISSLNNVLLDSFTCLYSRQKQICKRKEGEKSLDHQSNKLTSSLRRGACYTRRLSFRSHCCCSLIVA